LKLDQVVRQEGSGSLMVARSARGRVTRGQSHVGRPCDGNATGIVLQWVWLDWESSPVAERRELVRRSCAKHLACPDLSGLGAHKIHSDYSAPATGKARSRTSPAAATSGGDYNGPECSSQWAREIVKRKCEIARTGDAVPCPQSVLARGAGLSLAISKCQVLQQKDQVVPDCLACARRSLKSV